MIDTKSFKTLGTQRSVTVMIILSLIAVLTTFILTTFYLAYNETRIGYQLHDPILSAIIPVDLSQIIFICTYSCIIIGLICSMTTPERIVRTNLVVLCLLLYRLFFMYLFPLEPPIGIIPLQDEFLMNTTYGNKVLEKDLFFSGHTASVVILYYLVEHKYVSKALLFMSFIIGSMLIIQHVHYTIDVIAAYAFAFISYKSGSRLTDISLKYTRYFFLFPAKVIFAK